MDKHCNHCKDKLVLNTNWTIGNKNCHNYKCTKCISDYRKKHYKEKRHLVNKTNYDWYNKVAKDGLCHVYVTSDNYAGVFTQKRRINHWENKGHKVRVIYSTPDPYDARELEDLLHDIGYKGGGGYHDGNINGITKSLELRRNYLGGTLT